MFLRTAERPTWWGRFFVVSSPFPEDTCTHSRIRMRDSISPAGEADLNRVAEPRNLSEGVNFSHDLGNVSHVAGVDHQATACQTAGSNTGSPLFSPPIVSIASRRYQKLVSNHWSARQIFARLVSLFARIYDQQKKRRLMAVRVRHRTASGLVGALSRPTPITECAYALEFLIRRRSGSG